MYNKIMLIGRLTATPELQKTAKDRAYCRVRLAVNRRYKSSDGKKEADFISVIFWGRQAETLASYANKGALLTVDGELRTNRYEKAGEWHYTSEVMAQGFQLLESRSQRAKRDNQGGEDLSDLVLEGEALPF